MLADVSPTARLDAEVLLMHVLSVGRPALITRASETFDAQQNEKFTHMVARRRAGEPVAYITGVREFWSLPIHVTPAVLIPRPETELLVECALARIARNGDSNVADLGTGSGAIALAIAHERSRCHITATDSSAEALNVARENAHRLGIGNIEFRSGEWLAPLAGKHFDVIVSNPPYIPADDRHLSEGDVRFEPRAALVSGADGLDAIRHIARESRKHLRQSSWLLLEHGHDQAEAVAEVLHRAGFHETVGHRDLQGHTRVTEAR